MNLLELRGISREVLLPDESVLPILTGVDLDVAPGEHVAIVGRSGSGKSTLLNLLGLLDTPTSGSYLLDGEPTDGLSSRRRSRLRGEVFGFVFQQFNLLPRRTAAENVLVVPVTAVQGSVQSGRVWIPGADGEPVERPVTLGLTDGDQVEVTGGLTEGEMVLQFVPIPDDDVVDPNTGGMSGG